MAQQLGLANPHQLLQPTLNVPIPRTIPMPTGFGLTSSAAVSGTGATRQLFGPGSGSDPMRVDSDQRMPGPAPVRTGEVVGRVDQSGESNPRRVQVSEGDNEPGSSPSRTSSRQSTHHSSHRSSHQSSHHTTPPRSSRSSRPSSSRDVPEPELPDDRRRSDPPRGSGSGFDTQGSQSGSQQGKGRSDRTTTEIRNALLSGFEEMTNALTSGRSEQTLGSNADPKFPEWDGSPHTIHSWINNATHLVELHGTVDQKAIRFARIKLAQYLRNSYPRDDPPQTWKEFTRWLRQRFSPSQHDLQTRMRLSTGAIKIKGTNLLQYFAEFQEILADCHPPLDEVTAQTFFLGGLNTFPYLQYSILHDWRGGTLQQMMDQAWRLHTGVVHPTLMNVARPVGLGAAVSEMDPTPPPPLPATPTPATAPSPTPMDLDVLRVLLANFGVTGGGTSPPPTNPPALTALESPFVTGKDMMRYEQDQRVAEQTRRGGENVTRPRMEREERPRPRRDPREPREWERDDRDRRRWEKRERKPRRDDQYRERDTRRSPS